MLLSHKGSLSSLSRRDIFVISYLLKNLRINWAKWFLGYMQKSYQDSGGNNSLLYGLLISRIVKDIGIDLSKYPAKEVSSTYDSWSFASIRYVLYEGTWLKKSRFKPKHKVDVEEIPSINDFGDALKAIVDSL
ncbi:hypothetical protein HAX54_020535 [Datura stramonium]|uniref:Uncharacterized protein n=1 Tax=Datura stramonium TaxID=4076 RepID=A0ABS8UR87_DATST|nr:hypothetical protein [Datura stramonium]